MVHLHDVVDEIKFKQAINDGLVSRRFHPELPLAILNYTPACQYSRTWNDTTRACRGLIYDHETMEVVARPFEKFMNWNEPDAGRAPYGKAIRMPKADGSLGVVFNYKGRWLVSTRGSFVSEQAKWAQKWLNDFIPTVDNRLMNPFVTYCAEIVFPANRIVLDYNGLETLILLDVISPDSGRSMESEFKIAPFENKVERVMAHFDPEDVNSITDGEGEGFVYLWPKENIRLKAKTPWYVETHRIVTNLTERSVWEMMVEGKSLEEMKQPIPEEFYEFVEETHSEITKTVRDKIVKVGNAYTNIMYAVGYDCTRAEFAALAVKSPLSKYLFLLHDRREIGTLALQDAKPASATPIKE